MDMYISIGMQNFYKNTFYLENLNKNQSSQYKSSAFLLSAAVTKALYSYTKIINL